MAKAPRASLNIYIQTDWARAKSFWSLSKESIHPGVSEVVENLDHASCSRLDRQALLIAFIVLLLYSPFPASVQLVRENPFSTRVESPLNFTGIAVEKFCFCAPFSKDCLKMGLVCFRGGIQVVRNGIFGVY